MLVLEQDDTLLSWDNQRLIEFTRAAGCRDTLRYEHRSRRSRAVARGTRRDCLVLGQGRPLAPPHRRRRHRRPRAVDRTQTTAKPERHGRPAGSRAHFLRLNATRTSNL